MSEKQLSFFDEEANRQHQRQQRKAELDALMIQHIGLEATVQWYEKKNKRHAKLEAILSQPLRPDLQAAVDALRAKVMASVKPFLANECALLGIDLGASKREIRNAYRRQARKLHPDVGGDEAAFTQLHAAYRRLLAAAKE